MTDYTYNIVTAAEATAYLTGYDQTDWQALKEAQQNDHIYWASLWIRENYSCADETVDAVMHACALLAYADYSSDGTLYVNKTTASGTIKRTRVKAGSVETEKEYVSGITNPSARTANAKAISLLDSVCTAVRSGGMIGLVRN